VAYPLELEDVESRLHKLYNALETGKLELEDLAPRIKALRTQKDDLGEKRGGDYSRRGEPWSMPQVTENL